MKYISIISLLAFTLTQYGCSTYTGQALSRTGDQIKAGSYGSAIIQAPARIIIGVTSDIFSLGGTLSSEETITAMQAGTAMTAGHMAYKNSTNSGASEAYAKMQKQQTTQEVFMQLRASQQAEKESDKISDKLKNSKPGDIINEGRNCIVHQPAADNREYLKNECNIPLSIYYCKVNIRNSLCPRDNITNHIVSAKSDLSSFFEKNYFRMAACPVKSTFDNATNNCIIR